MSERPLASSMVPIRHESDVVVVRAHIRSLGSCVGLSEVAIESLATAATEIAHNILIHAGQGHLHIVGMCEAQRQGIAVTARDEGPGIKDLGRAMEDGFSTIGSLGLGLPSARRLVDEFEIESHAGRGTTVTLRAWSRLQAL